MRSRSRPRNQAAVRRHSSGQRSSSRSSSGRQEKAEVKPRSRKNDHPHKRTKAHKDVLEKTEHKRNHHGRRRKNSSDSESQLRMSARENGPRRSRRSRSPKQRARRSRSRSLDKKMQRETGRGRRHNVAPPKPSDSGAKISSEPSQKRSRSRDGARSPRSKRKTTEDAGYGTTEQREDTYSRVDGFDLLWGMRKRPARRKRLDQTSLMLNDRFSQFYDAKPLVLDESVAIEIERNIDGDEPFVIPNFHPHEVSLPHRSSEGKKPLSSRKEFMSGKTEVLDAEKRVVTVMRSFTRESAFGNWRRQGQTVQSSNENTNNQPMLFWKDLECEAVIQVPVVTSDKMKDADLEVTSATNHQGQRVIQNRRDKNERHWDLPESRSQGSRHFSEFPEDQRTRPMRGQGQNFRVLRGANRRHELSGRRRPAERFRSTIASSVAYGTMPMLAEEKNQPAELPDFSRRPDKYAYDVWRDRPEMIPKGRSYFEHDNRSDELPWEVNRNRGRGGLMRGGRARNFITQGLQRFQNSGFRRRSGSPDPLQWKHDKFEALLEDEKPSSTTEK